MALFQANRQSSGGGGGGLTITGFAIDQFTTATAFTAGSLVFTLSQTPVTPMAVLLTYNGEAKQYTTEYTISGDQVTIEFADPYVPDYEDPVSFQISYCY